MSWPQVAKKLGHFARVCVSACEAHLVSNEAKFRGKQPFLQPRVCVLIKLEGRKRGMLDKDARHNSNGKTHTYFFAQRICVKITALFL